MLKIFNAIIVCLLLSACASGQTYTEFSKTLQAPQKNMARLFFFREWSADEHIWPHISINKEFAGKLDANGYFVCNLPAGGYAISMALAQGFYKQEDDGKSMNVKLRPGETVYLQFSRGNITFTGNYMNSAFSLQVVDQSVAQKILPKLRMSEPNCK